jgi:hypothetical protein
MHAQLRKPLNINTAKFLPVKMEKKLLYISSGYFYTQGLKKTNLSNICQILDQWCQKIDVLLFLFIDEFLFFLA